jgi:phosphoribosylglycinamide formyltransferase-1
MTARIGVLASGGGSNLGALLEHLDRLGPRRSGEVVLVASSVAGAGALERARRRGIPGIALDPAARDPHLVRLLDEHRVDVIALAGYLKLVPRAVVRRYRGRILNVHPALLPAHGGPGMYGLRVHCAVLAAGDAASGVTVHFVDEAYDRGAVIAQWPVPVLAGDTPETLAERVLRVEHVIYPRVVDAVAGDRVHLGPDGTVRGIFATTARGGVRALLPQGDDALARELESALAR